MMNLKYDVRRMIAAEQMLGKTVQAIIDELGSDQGASLTTISAMVACGIAGDDLFILHGAGAIVDALYARRAMDLIEAHGLARVGGAISVAMLSYMQRAA